MAATAPRNRGFWVSDSGNVRVLHDFFETQQIVKFADLPLERFQEAVSLDLFLGLLFRDPDAYPGPGPLFDFLKLDDGENAIGFQNSRDFLKG